jgi:hypothetical protein
MVAVSEDPQSGVGPDAPVSPDAGPDVPVSPDAGPDVPVSPDAGPDVPVSPEIGQDVIPARATRLSDIVVGHLSDQARRTAQGAKARRMATTDGQPGMADLTPLRELLADLVEEGRNVRLRERIARVLRQAADIIDPQGRD